MPEPHEPYQRNRGSSRLATAATLAELVVTGVMVAAVLLVLAPARQIAASRAADTTCLANLRALGAAVGMYTGASKGILPGPSSAAIHRYVTEQSPPQEKERSLTWKLRTVLGDVIDDQMVTCPVVEAVNPDGNFEEFWKRRGRRIAPTHYCLNNPPPSSLPERCYRTTDPPWYFGWSQPPAVSPPRNVDEIAHPAKEWMIADAWYRPRVNAGLPGLCQEGPFQTDWTGEVLPNFAPHGDAALRRFHFFDSPGARAAASAQIRADRGDGETNSLFFDGHAAAGRSRVLLIHGIEFLYGYYGTVNPQVPLPSGAHWE